MYNKGEMNMKTFSTRIIDIGNEAPDMIKAGFFILFGEKVPIELKDYCYIINIQPISSPIVSGKTLVLGNKKTVITSVGKDVVANLENLGHVTVKFDGSTTAELPGTIYVEKIHDFHLSIGDTIEII